MLPESDLPLRVLDDRAHVDFLGAQDEPWLRVLVGEAERFEGRRRRELAERLAEPLPCEAPPFKLRAAARVLLRLWRGPVKPPIDPRVLRAVVFGAAAATGAPPGRVWDETAAVVGIARERLERTLFMDLPPERPVHAPAPPTTAPELALRTNLAIAQALLMRASLVELAIAGATRPVVRLAKLRGLIVTARRGAGDPTPPVLELSGPFALFRHTLLYGRALAELLPHLAWCARFSLRARCALRGRIVDVELDKSAPIFPAGAPRPFDSRLEARLAAELGRLAPEWDVVREPAAIPAGDTLVFPDFLLRDRVLGREAYVELVGFWTPEYLAAKLARLRAAKLANLILCVDADRACADGDLPEGATLVTFRRRVDAAAVVATARRLMASSGRAAGHGG